MLITYTTSESISSWLVERNMAGTADTSGDISFIKLGLLLEDSTKTVKYLQNLGVLPDKIKKDCMFCGMQKCVVLHKRSERIIPFVLKCTKCRKGVTAATNTWFEKDPVIYIAVVGKHIYLKCMFTRDQNKFSLT